MTPPRKGYRTCSRCERNRREDFFLGTRGRICKTCRSHKVARTTRSVRIQQTYNITQEEYDALFAAQGGKCAICGGVRRANLDIDHDHRAAVEVGTRASVRGLLCRSCNRRLLRAAKDSVAILGSAIRYLEDPPARKVLQ